MYVLVKSRSSIFLVLRLMVGKMSVLALNVPNIVEFVQFDFESATITVPNIIVRPCILWES